MARFYYDLIESGHRCLSNVELREFKEAEVIIIDNVVEYVNKNNKKIEHKDLPLLVPPFKKIFIEANRPMYFKKIKKYKGKLKIYGRRWGYLVTYKKQDYGYELYIKEYTDRTSHIKRMKPEKISNYLQVSKSHPMTLRLNEKGYANKLFLRYSDKTYRTKKRKIYYGKIMPMLFALSLMNCANVEYVENTFDNEAEVSEKSERKHNKKYKTLKVKPMQNNIQKKSNCIDEENIMPLHICRGHFKDYREKGLFGKYKGIYWWDSQVRGNAENGEVKKDYEIVV